MTTRALQYTTPGFGKHFVSPKKVRDPRKTTTQSVVPGQAAKHRQSLAKLKALQNPVKPLPEDVNSIQSQDVESYASGPDCAGQQPDIDTDVPFLDPPNHPMDDQPCASAQRRLIPDAAAFRLYNNWNKLIQSLVNPFLEYLTVSTACVHPPTGDIHSTCNIAACTPKKTDITALFFDRTRFLFFTRSSR
jgi:hypothetical protein